MLRRWIGALIAACILACGAALAESVYYGDMTVEHCQEWVSLRDVPGTGGKRLAKVPLHATVTDAEWDRFCGDFTYCRYEGQYGYIMSCYLEPAAPESGEGGLVMDRRVGNMRYTARRVLADGREYLTVNCEDAYNGPRWTYETATEGMTELTLTDAFLAGPAQDPMVMVYNAEQGLTALDAFSGETRWQLAEPHLGASVTWAASGDGTVYIGGYYGPDPVAVDYNGHVLWRADSGGCAWLYRMELSEAEGTLTCWYDLMADGGSGQVVYDLRGKLLKKRAD